ETPQALIFQCIQAPKKGGETIFCDTVSLLGDLPLKKLGLLSEVQIKYKTEKLAHYGGEVTQNLIDIHPITKSKVLRYGEVVKTLKNPVTREIVSGNITSDELETLDLTLYQKEYQLVHRWQDGDILIADNISLLHGRNKFNSNQNKRHIRRMQLR
ncbi:TauD/TfdA family dioxygenase, partial [bacterium]|nr:TauD/TfdA family dioxygenase [bacterium]